MSIASRIQEIETHIGDVYDTINYSYDTTGINKNIINIPKYLKKGYIDIINNGTDNLYSNFPKVSGIGSNLSLTPTYEAPMKLNEIQGDTLQDGTPTPNTPVPIQSVTGLQNVNVCGKNLFNKDSGFINAYIDTSGVIHDNVNSNALFTYIKVQSNTTYTFSCNTSLRNLGINEFNSSKTFISRTQSQNVGSLTITTSSTTNYLRLQINYDNTTSITQAIIDSLNLQLEQGFATSYEPYKGNTYEVNLGKNLVDFSNLQTNNNTTYTWQNDILEVKATTGTYSRAYIDITNLYKNNPNKSIRFDYDSIDFSQGINPSVHLQIVQNGTNNYVVLVDTDGSITTRTIPNDTSEITQVLLRVVCNNTNTSQASQISITKPILHFGNIATSYSPYFTPIELNKIGDYKDSIKKSTGKNIITTYNYASSGYINYNYDNSKIGKTMTYSFIPNFSTTNASLYIRANTSISSYKVGTISTITSGTKVSVTFTLTDEQYDTIKNTNGGYIQVYKSGVSMDENSISNPMLEINSQSTSYEPYGKVWYIEKQIGKVVLDGSENGFLISSNDNGYLFGISSKTFPLENYSTNYISNYSLANSTSISTTANIGSYIYNNIFRMRVPSTIATTFDNFKTWLSTHNTEVLYVLNTPTYTEITNTELIEDLETLYTAKSQEGTTNISITSEDLEMILNVSALKGEV